MMMDSRCAATRRQPELADVNTIEMSHHIYLLTSAAARAMFCEHAALRIVCAARFIVKGAACLTVMTARNGPFQGLLRLI